MPTLTPIVVGRMLGVSLGCTKTRPERLPVSGTAGGDSGASGRAGAMEGPPIGACMPANSD